MTGFTAKHRQLLDAMLDKAPWPHRAGVYSMDEEEAEAMRALRDSHDELAHISQKNAENWADATAENVRLAGRVKVLEDALRLLVADVQDYEAWQRPCHALDVARAALSAPATQSEGK